VNIKNFWRLPSGIPSQGSPLNMRNDKFAGDFSEVCLRGFQSETKIDWYLGMVIPTPNNPKGTVSYV